MRNMFSDHNGIKLNACNRKKFRKLTNMWKLNSAFFNNYWVKEEVKRKVRKYCETMQMKIQQIKM